MCHQCQQPQPQTIALLTFDIIVCLWKPAFLLLNPKITLKPTISSKPSQKRVYFFSNFCNTLFYQKSLVQAVLGSNQQNITTKDIATYRLNHPRGRVSDKPVYPGNFPWPSQGVQHIKWRLIIRSVVVPVSGMSLSISFRGWFRPLCHGVN